MKRNIWKYLSFGTVAVLIVMMMAATVLEKLKGSPEAFRLVYHHPVFMVLWAVTALSGLVWLFKRGAPKKVFTFGLHLSFVFILAGALVTHLWGESGEVHLAIHEEAGQFTLDKGGSRTLPFSLRLENFSITRYPGSAAPADFSSTVTLLPLNETRIISMNHILKYKGYRFYQADFDRDMQGSTLAVSHDPWGVGLTYAGYLLLLVCMLGFFFQKDSAFRSALKRVASMTAVISALMVIPSFTSEAKSTEVKEALNQMYVYYGHRVCPFATYLKENGMDKTVENLDKVKIFPLEGTDGTITWYSSSDELPESAFEKEDLLTFIRKSPDVIRMSLSEGNDAEAARIINGIKAYQEKTASSVLPSKSKANAERMYISIARPKVQFMLSLTLGIILFILGGVLISKKRKFPRWVLLTGAAIALLLWVYLSIVIGLRWYVSGSGPYVGKYNVMMLMAWFSTLAIVLLHRRFPLVEPLGFLLAGFTMLLASRESVSPQITPLMPVLQSPLLSIHVLSMMMSYTLFGLVAFNGIMGVAVTSKEAKRNLMDVSLAVLYPAVFLLTFGTFLGAVWANISWGSYWAWDPKETWALVTMLVYSFTLHNGAIKVFRNPTFFHAYTIFAFICVLITYFGVNLILGGMHSYA